MKNKTVRQWTCLGISISYFFVPADIISDMASIIGYLDDIVVLYLEVSLESFNLKCAFKLYYLFNLYFYLLFE